MPLSYTSAILQVQKKINRKLTENEEIQLISLFVFDDVTEATQLIQLLKLANLSSPVQSPVDELKTSVENNKNFLHLIRKYARKMLSLDIPKQIEI